MCLLKCLEGLISICIDAPKCMYDIILCDYLLQIAMELADRYNTALVCHRWHYLACHPRMWLRVDRSVKDLSEPGVFPDLKAAVSAARFGKLQTAFL